MGNALLFRLSQTLASLSLEMRTMDAFGAIVVGLLVFGSIAEDVLEGESHAFDTAIILHLRTPGDLAEPIGPPWFDAAVIDVTALGGFTILAILVILAAIYLMLARRMRDATIVLIGTSSGSGLVSLLKTGFDRPRPALVEHLAAAASSSFPSGHATTSAMVYLTLGLLLAQAQKERRIRIFVVFCALFVTVLIGFSRVYLGVHWPSDVIAGWGLGAAWAILWWLIARWLGSTAASRSDP